MDVAYIQRTYDTLKLEVNNVAYIRRTYAMLRTGGEQHGIYPV